MVTGIDGAAAAAQVDEPSDSYQVPTESWLRLFLRFLRFGALAWGGSVAQIAMIRQELVDEERWISSAHFNRVLAAYQVLPGPEAHELCVYFGMAIAGATDHLFDLRRLSVPLAHIIKGLRTCRSSDRFQMTAPIL